MIESSGRWLMKTEPSVFSWDDLERAANRMTPWEGVRNYQARNFMRDQMRVGDLVFVYHSSTDEPAVVGIGCVASEAYPDASQFDEESPYFDAKATRKNPRWILRDIRAVERLPNQVTLAAMRLEPGLSSMLLLKRGMRLSIQPVTISEWNKIVSLGSAQG